MYSTAAGKQLLSGHWAGCILKVFKPQRTVQAPPQNAEPESNLMSVSVSIWTRYVTYVKGCEQYSLNMVTIMSNTIFAWRE